MNHDVAHCAGGKCVKKEACMRYVAYREAMEIKYKFPLRLIDASVCIDRQHSAFVEMTTSK